MNSKVVPVTEGQESHVVEIQYGRWSVGLCGCCSNCIPNCCMSTCCLCISLAQIYARLGIISYKTASLCFVLLTVLPIIIAFIPPDSSTENFVFGLVTKALVAAFNTAVWFARTRVRERFSIPGGDCDDGCSSCSCTCCAIGQMATHIRSYKIGDCYFGGPDVLPGYPSK